LSSRPRLFLLGLVFVQRAGLLTVWSPMREAGALQRKAQPLKSRAPSRRHHAPRRRGSHIWGWLASGALTGGGVLAIAFWAPQRQAQMILPVISTLAAAAITGWWSSRRPRR
jgi:hypothetical protein